VIRRGIRVPRPLNVTAPHAFIDGLAQGKHIAGCDHRHAPYAVEATGIGSDHRDAGGDGLQQPTRLIFQPSGQYDRGRIL
jgi:hypothetical protein